MQEIRLVSGAQTLGGTLVRSGESVGDREAPGLLFVHGLGSDRTGYVDRARRAAQEIGATCLAVDLAGHGSSTGTLEEVTPRQHLHDVIAAYDALAARPDVAPGRVGVCAASYGACLAVLLSASRPVARLLLRAPSIVADLDLDRPLGARSDDRRRESATELFDGLRRFLGPVLVVESGHDEVIGHEVIEEYASVAPAGSARVIPGATHALTRPAWRAEFERLILEFFRDL